MARHGDVAAPAPDCGLLGRHASRLEGIDIEELERVVLLITVTLNHTPVFPHGEMSRIAAVVPDLE